MAKMLISWDHAEERNLERIPPESRARINNTLKQLTTMEAPPLAVGHYSWYIDIPGAANTIVARLIIRGVAVRTVYNADMRPPQSAARYKIDRNTNKFVKC